MKNLYFNVFVQKHFVLQLLFFVTVRNTLCLKNYTTYNNLPVKKKTKRENVICFIIIGRTAVAKFSYFLSLIFNYL